MKIINFLFAFIFFMSSKIPDTPSAITYIIEKNIKELFT